MAGTLVISNLSDGTTSTSATNAIQGSAKAWVNFNGVTTATIRASYNVSSVTRNSTGNYTVNFSSAMTDANYAVVFGAGPYDNNRGGPYLGGYFSGNPGTAPEGNTKLAGSFQFSNGLPGSATMQDLQSFNCAVFR